MKRNSTKIREFLSRIPEDVYERTRKAMTCKWHDGGECKKGLPGTPCDVKSCIAKTNNE